MKNAILKFLQFGTLLSTYGLILSVSFQIFARFFLPSAPAWTEEASRLFFIYAVGFSAGLALESQDYVSLDWFFEKLPKRVQQFLVFLVASLVFILFAMICFYAFQFVRLGHQEYSPGMKIRMSYVFFSMVILSGSLSYFAGRSILLELKKQRA